MRISLLPLSPGVLALGSLTLCLLTSACDSKVPDAEKTALSAVVPPPPPPIKEPPPPQEEAPKKPPRECPPGKGADFGGNAPLEAEVRRKLAKPEGEITIADLGKVRSLNLSQVRIDELDPCIFPHLTGAKEVFLGAGKLDDLTPLKNLKNLESLRASLNRVSDVSPLAGLVKLDRLDLGGTQITDIKPLANLTMLTELDLSTTPVSDIEPLAALTKLERLSLKRTNVKDLSPLKGLKELKALDISDTTADGVSLMRKGLKITD
jgi:internalin A